MFSKLLVVLFFLAGCTSENPMAKKISGKKNDESSNSEKTDSSNASLTYNYDDHIKGWLDAHCISCHGPEDQYDFSTYSKAARFGERFIVRLKDKDNPMPPVSANDNISQGEFDKMNAWVEAGMPRRGSSDSGNDGGSDGSGSGSGDGGIQFTYNDHIRGWLDFHCISCHGPNDQYDFSTYELASASADEFVKRIKDKDNPMPPVSANDVISDRDLRKMEAWADEGAPRGFDDDEGGTSGDDPGEDKPEQTEFSFTYVEHMKGWLDHHCISCHGPTDQFDFSTYDKAKAAAGEMLARMENDANPMPPAAAVAEGKAPGVPGNDLVKFETWVEEGAPRGSAYEFTYDNHIKGWIDHFCISCHGAADEYDFSTKDQAEKYVTRMLIRMAKRSDPMPPQAAIDEGKALAVPVIDYVKLKKWRDDGAP